MKKLFVVCLTALLLLGTACTTKPEKESKTMLPDLESRSEGGASHISEPLRSSVANQNQTERDSSASESEEEIDTIEVVDEYVAEVSGNVEIGGN